MKKETKTTKKPQNAAKKDQDVYVKLFKDIAAGPSVHYKIVKCSCD